MTVKRERRRKTKLSRKQRREDRSMQANKTAPSTQEPPTPHPPTPIALSICPPSNLPATKHSMVAAILTSAFPLQESTNMARTTRNIARLIPTKPKIPNAWKVAYQSGRKVHKNNGIVLKFALFCRSNILAMFAKACFCILELDKTMQQAAELPWRLRIVCFMSWLFAWSIGRLIALMAT